MKKTIFLLLTLLAGTGLTGCAGSEAHEDTLADSETEYQSESDLTYIYGKDVEDGLLRIGLDEQVPTMDVQKTNEHYMIPLNIYERLFEIRVNDDGSTQLVNGLAEDYSISNDGLTYSFTIRDDAFFSDGTKVKASDVAFTFTRMLTDPNSVQTDFADMIYGARALMVGEVDELKGVRVIDDNHLQITLTEPYAGYLYELATPSCSILDEDFVTGAGNSYGSSAELTIGSGPYMVTEFTDSIIMLERNPYYNCRDWEKLTVAKAELLVLPPALMDQMFREGGLDLLDANLVNPDTVETVYKTDKWSSSLISKHRVDIQYLMLNVDAAPLNDVRIRKAVQMAIDRQAILDELYGGDGQLVDGIFPRGLNGYCEANQGWLTYDPDEARRLISEVPGTDEIRLEIAASSKNSTRRLALLEMVSKYLEDAGLDVSVVSYDPDSLMYLRQAGRLMAYSSEWSADYNDPDNFIYTFFGNRAKTYNRSGNFSDEAVFKRISDARAIQDEDKRMEEYARLEKLLVHDEAVWVPLFSTNHLFVLGKRVESFTPFWAGWSSLYFRDVVLKSEQ